MEKVEEETEKEEEEVLKADEQEVMSSDWATCVCKRCVGFWGCLFSKQKHNNFNVICCLITSRQLKL